MRTFALMAILAVANGLTLREDTTTAEVETPEVSDTVDAVDTPAAPEGQSNEEINA